jgi:hypothetical protein
MPREYWGEGRNGSLAALLMAGHEGVYEVYDKSSVYSIFLLVLVFCFHGLCFAPSAGGVAGKIFA